MRSLIAWLLLLLFDDAARDATRVWRTVAFGNMKEAVVSLRRNVDRISEKEERC
jgi:hypothetical protein